MSGNDGSGHITRASQTALSDSILALAFAYKPAGKGTLGQSKATARAQISLGKPSCSDLVFCRGTLLRCGNTSYLGNCIKI